MPADNSNRPNARKRSVDWKALVSEVTNLKAPHPSYEFSKRTFKETDKDGVYSDS